MGKVTIEDKISIPEGVEATLNGTLLKIKGKNGEIEKDYFNPKIQIAQKEGQIVLTSKNASKKEKKTIFTFSAHIKNQIKGANEKIEYTLKICSGHFPMSVNLKGDVFEVTNFIGESVPRRLKIKPGADVKIDGDKIVVSGSDLSIVSQTAANIESLTRRPNFDKRVFMDGIWIIDKNGKQIA